MLAGVDSLRCLLESEAFAGDFEQFCQADHKDFVQFQAVVDSLGSWVDSEAQNGSCEPLTDRPQQTAEADDDEFGQLRGFVGIHGGQMKQNAGESQQKAEAARVNSGRSPESLAYFGDCQKVQDHEDPLESQSADNFPLGP